METLNQEIKGTCCVEKLWKRENSGHISKFSKKIFPKNSFPKKNKFYS
jgi:hypothetical protein